MAESFQINSILVTGTNRGLGLKLVEVLLTAAKPPRYIFACYRDANKITNLRKLALEHQNLKLIKMDVTSDVDIINAFSLVQSIMLDDCNGLDVLINNAAIFEKSNLSDVTSKMMEDLFRVNAVAPLMIVKSFLPLLKESSVNSINGVIVNVSSGNGSLTNPPTLPDKYPYKCSKVALNMVTKNLSIDLERYKVATMAINPGWMATDMGRPNAPRTPDESARAITDLIKNLTIDRNGGFFDIHGKTIPW
ncbi:C-factor [Trichoplax sp. H2]|nr:C-factor [Trichoplax sp. H2]|eukprot:RDD43508.1 C-factor [Trichoplax sp. H2]